MQLNNLLIYCLINQTTPKAKRLLRIIGEHTGETLRHHGINPDIQAPIETAARSFDQLKAH